MPNPPLRTLVRLAVAAAALSALLSSLTVQIRSTGAVPGDEFEAAGVLYGALPWLIPMSRLLAALVGLWVLWHAVRDSTALIRGARVGAGIALAIAPWVGTPGFIIVATFLLWWAGTRTVARDLEATDGDRAVRQRDIARALADPGRGAFARWWLVVGLLTTAGALLVTLAESYAYTADFAPRLFRFESLSPYRLRLIGLSAQFGMGLGLAYFIPILVVRRLARRAGPLGGRALLRFALVLALTACGYVAVAMAAHVGPEIWKTGVWPHAIALLALLFVLWHHTVLAAFLSTGFRLPGDAAPTPARVWTLAATSLLLPPMDWRNRTRAAGVRAHYLTCALWAVLWLAFLVHTSYPELEDFRSQFIFIGVFTAIHVVVMGLLSLLFALRAEWTRRTERRVVFGLSGLALLCLVLGVLPLRGDEPLILHEYSRFGWVVKKASLKELLFGFDSLGNNPGGHTFEFHGPGDGRFPAEVPAILQARRPPIVFIMWDAGRPDRMGCYGYHRDTTPHADALAADAIVFDRAYSASTATTCGVRHIMTGMYSSRYMLSTQHHPFFVHALRRHGYDRVLVTAFGTDFNGVSIDAFERSGPPPATDGARFEHLTRHPRGLNRELPDSVKTQSVIDAWKAVHRERGSLDRTFTWLHLTGAHFPWFNENPVKDYGTDNDALYDGEVAKVDALTGNALRSLKSLGAYDDAIIVLLADHGTGLMEHGRWAGFLPYEEQLRIPLIIKMPGLPPRRIPHPVTTIDLAPTLVGLFEPKMENPYHGVSVLGLMNGRATRVGRRDFVALCAFEDAYALFEDNRWKLHYHRSEGYSLLFDLEADPGELRNLLEERPDVAQRLTDKLGAWLHAGRGRFSHPHHYWEWSFSR
jgi:arylsulfatase A-like enzyme